MQKKKKKIPKIINDPSLLENIRVKDELDKHTTSLIGLKKVFTTVSLHQHMDNINLG